MSQGSRRASQEGSESVRGGERARQGGSKSV